LICFFCNLHLPFLVRSGAMSPGKKHLLSSNGRNQSWASTMEKLSAGTDTDNKQPTPDNQQSTH
jgi:hypothetical protein